MTDWKRYREYDIRCARCGLVLDHDCSHGLKKAALRLIDTVAFLPGLGYEERKKLEIDVCNLLRSAGAKPGPLIEEAQAAWIEDMTSW